MLNAMIVDDEAPARSELRYLLEETRRTNSIVEAASAREAVERLMEQRADVLFLDISMPKTSGMQLAEALRKLKNPPAVVFVTAYSEYALEAFGVDAVDYLMKPDTFANPACILTNSSGSYGVTIAEHIIAVSLFMMRRLTDYYSSSVNGEWEPVHFRQYSLKDSRITVLGTGDIGCEFAKRARAFEPEKIVGVSRSGVCSDPSFDAMYKIGSLDEILPETDLLVMSLPSTPETIDILNRSRIELLPQGAFVVNVGRGTAIDEDAIADALENGHLGGAALDVFKTEPLPSDSRLWKIPNLLITPHIAGNLTLKHTLDKNVDMFCEDLENFLTGRAMKYEVDRKRGY